MLDDVFDNLVNEIGGALANCPKRGWCEATVDYNCEATFDYNKSMTILEGKEVILEVI